MRAIRRCWQPRPAPAHGRVLQRHGPYRAGPVAPRPAVRTPESGTPLSLSDIIAFESDLPRLVDSASDAKAEELIKRASRVLAEVNTVLADEEEQPRQGGQNGQRGSASARPRDGLPPSASTSRSASPAAAGSGPSPARLSNDELSRAIFGGSSQVSEREASATRQALQKTLEAGEAPSSSSSGGGSSADGGAGGEADQPAWAAALFSGAAPAAAAPTSAPLPASRSSSASPPAAAAPPKASASWRTDPVPATAAATPRPSAPSPPSTSPPSPQSAGPSASAPSSSSAPSSASAPPSPFAPSPPTPQLLPQEPAARRLPAWAPLAFAEADLALPTELLLKSEDAVFAAAARAAVLPPLQSVVDLTAAARPPSRGLDLGSATEAAVSEAVAVSEDEVVQGGALGRRLADGVGRLADGTRFEKLSGTDYGADGYVKHWEVLRGVTGDGTVQWEECWWKASSRTGLRELGAFKKGTTESGSAWREEWKELLHTHPTNLRLVIERTAHKWARDDAADEWEEKWGESFEEAGRVHKFADKWAKAGSNVWHERWGEDYDGRGACQKWTDKWAERLLPGGGHEQWGDKWTETFGDGRGTKHGEVWSSSSSAGAYNRWWNEEHYGDSRVRKWGNSNTGEFWDTVEHMDTYYNPVPHFGFGHAVGHSPQLWSVPLPAIDEGSIGSDDDGLGLGTDRL